MDTRLADNDKVLFMVGSKELLISQRKLATAYRSKGDKVISLDDGKIARRMNNGDWQVLLLDTGNRYKWFKSDWGDSEYLQNPDYIALVKPGE